MTNCRRRRRLTRAYHIHHSAKEQEERLATPRHPIYGPVDTTPRDSCIVYDISVAYIVCMYVCMYLYIYITKRREVSLEGERRLQTRRMSRSARKRIISHRRRFFPRQRMILIDWPSIDRSICSHVLIIERITRLIVIARVLLACVVHVRTRLVCYALGEGRDIRAAKLRARARARALAR